MDIAKLLIKCVARAFYDVKHTLVLDALMIHNALRDDELARLMGLQLKDTHKLCGKLKEDRLIAVHTRTEQKEGQQRPTNRIYYYIDFRNTIDAIKFRMHALAKSVESQMNSDADQKGFVCPRCRKRFAMLDVTGLELDTMTGDFVCDRCASFLVDDDDSAEVQSSRERLGRMIEQTKKIVEYLKKVDEVIVPENDFETAINNSVPVPSIAGQGQVVNSVPVLTGAAAKAAKAKEAQSQGTLEIKISETGEKSKAEILAEQQRKQQQAEKNALPVWHTQSTVDGGVTNAGMKEVAEKKLRDTEVGGVIKKEEEEDQKEGVEGAVQEDAIREYYAALAAQKDKEAEEDQDEDDDDEDEEDFEDALDVSAVPSNAPTPAIAATNAPSIEGEPPEKKVKTEPSPEEEESEEEADFEDVS